MPTHRFSVAIVFVLVLPGMARADVRLPSIISDHMVLTRSVTTPIWGHAEADEEVTVELDGKTAQTRAGRDGKWKVELNLADAGPGPFRLTVRGRNEIAVSDVLVGEVWLASGQSNMEFLLKFTAGADKEIAGAKDPLLRQFRVKKTVRPEPADDCQGTWVLAAPDTAGDFTAVGYYFAKELHKTLNVPVGIINASWGGTFSEAWTSRDAISRDQALKAADDQRRTIAAEYPAKKKAFVTEFGSWLKSNDRLDKPRPDVESFAGEKVATEDWVRLKLPGKIAAAGLPPTGVIWIRRDVQVPPGAVVAGQEFKIFIGQLDGFEQVYWNGKMVSETPYEKYPGLGYNRYFGVPPESVRVGTNTIALRIYAPVVTPTIVVSPASFYTGPVSLVGEWFARAEYALPELPPGIVAASPLPPPRPPAMMAGDIFNGVISPLIPYGLAGVIWYQGESNTGRAYQYRIAFPLLIDDWRQKWQRPDLPFYFCQLPGSGPKQTAPGRSEWAELREAQSMALKSPDTGQAVLIDLGESADLHPRNKQPVGHRLALIALAKQYHQSCVFSGPMYDSMVVEGSNARIRFSHTDGGLVAGNLPATYDVISKLGQTAPLVRNSPASELEGFSICGADRHWVWADARIEGNSVVVSSKAVEHPVAVRYAWADDPTCNLQNGAGLPASPFRTDDFPAMTADNHYGPGS